MSSTYINIYKKRFHILGISINIKVKLYEINNNEIGIVASSKKLNFTFSFSTNQINYKEINKEIKEHFQKLLIERNEISKVNKIIVFEMPDGELFISY